MSALETSSTVDDVPAQVRAMVGRSYRLDDIYEVGSEKVKEFARAVQSFDAAHFDIAAAQALGYDNLPAPTTFVSMVGFVAQRRMFEETFSCYALPQIVQIDQRLTFHRPLIAGDRISCEVSLESARKVSGMDLMVVDNKMFDANNEPLITASTTIAASTDIETPDHFMEIAEQIMMSGTVSATRPSALPPR